MDGVVAELYNNLCRQLNNFWPTPEAEVVLKDGSWIELSHNRFMESIRSTKSKYALDHSINYLNTVQYSIWLYYLSNLLGKQGNYTKLADKIYYLNKIMHSVDWYWQLELPNHFYAEHPLGSVLGRAQYGDYLMLYQGTTIGGNVSKTGLCYPTIGNYVTLYANATLLGNSRVGNKVILSANSFVKDEDIPDCSIVSGSSPNVSIRRMEEEKIDQYFKGMWQL